MDDLTGKCGGCFWWEADDVNVLALPDRVGECCIDPAAEGKRNTHRACSRYTGKAKITFTSKDVPPGPDVGWVDVPPGKGKVDLPVDIPNPQATTIRHCSFSGEPGSGFATEKMASHSTLVMDLAVARANANELEDAFKALLAQYEEEHHMTGVTIRDNSGGHKDQWGYVYNARRALAKFDGQAVGPYPWTCLPWNEPSKIE